MDCSSGKKGALFLRLDGWLRAPLPPGTRRRLPSSSRLMKENRTRGRNARRATKNAAWVDHRPMTDAKGERGSPPEDDPTWRGVRPAGASLCGVTPWAKASPIPRGVGRTDAPAARRLRAAPVGRRLRSRSPKTTRSEVMRKLTRLVTMVTLVGLAYAAGGCKDGDGGGDRAAKGKDGDGAAIDRGKLEGSWVLKGMEMEGGKGGHRPLRHLLGGQRDLEGERQGNPLQIHPGHGQGPQTPGRHPHRRRHPVARHLCLRRGRPADDRRAARDGGGGGRGERTANRLHDPEGLGVRRDDVPA